MAQTLHIVLDTSGSMGEDSKHHSAIYLLLTLRRFAKEHGIPLSLWQWHEIIEPLGNLSQILWTGSLDGYAFAPWYRRVQGNTTNLKNKNVSPVLLISDGDFPMDTGFRLYDACHLLLLGDGSFSYDFPSNRLWHPSDFMGQLILLQRRFHPQSQEEQP